MKEYPFCSQREQFEQWLRKTPDVRFWNTTDAMFAAFKAGLAQQAGGQVAEPSTVYVDVSGLTGTGKSAVAGEIEIAMRAIGLQVEWADGQAEKNMTGADWAHALEMYKPRVIIREKNISSATPAVEPRAESVRIDLDAATAAGEHAALGHLSRLVDEAADMLSQLRAMTDDMHKQWCNGGAPERGEFPLLDRVDDWLAARPTAQAEPVRVPELTAAANDVLAERQRQISAEGWTPEHDDEHGEGQLSMAAAAYAADASISAHLAEATGAHHDAAMQRVRGAHLFIRDQWPWDREWWKPSGQRRNLVKAGALILAEIERLDRLTAAKVKETPGHVDCGECPNITFGCESGHCLKAHGGS